MCSEGWLALWPGLVAMLALGADYGKQGGRGRGGGRASAAWQSPVKDRPLGRNSGINIKQKISQFEGLSHQDDGHESKAKIHGTPVTRTFSGDVLGNGVCFDNKSDELHRKSNLSKAVNLGLDFRENQASHRQFTAGRKSDSHQDRAHLNKATSSVTVPKLSPVLTQTQSSVSKLDVKKLRNNSIDSNDHFTDADVTSLPQCIEDPEDSLPPGNFYTSRGFWKRLEGEDSLWDKAKDSSSPSKSLVSGEAAQNPPERDVPPPKPQRTFQYQGGKSQPAHFAQWEKRISPVSQSKQGRKVDVIRPPSGPPPPCPVTSTNGFSRNRKNR